MSQVPLLVVEDSQPDVKMFKRLLKQMGVEAPVYYFQTGDEALDFLCKQGEYEGANDFEQPLVILLDLNLPGTDGRIILERLKQDINFKTIPIVVFTTSSAPSDIDYCYQRGANGYLVKPVDRQELQKTLRAFVDYWLNINVSPKISLMNP
jgi:CheY-like chemotaxis protein